MNSITINGITIDPSAPKPALASLSLVNANAKNSDYVLVQTRNPLDRAQRAQLAAAGAKILEAVPGGAFICHFPKTSLVKLRNLAFVAWADLYPGVVKLSPSLRSLDSQPSGVAAATAALSAPAALDATKVMVDVVLHRNANAKNAAKRIAAAAHLNISEVRIAGHKLRLTIKARRLADVVALDEVRHLEEVFPRKLANNVARVILRVPSNGAASGDEGQGEIVAVADTGFDQGSTSNVHPAFSGRVKKLYALGRPGRKDDPDGHGTHVAGSVLGNGVSKVDGPVRGTAPSAKLVLQSVLDSGGGLGGLPDNLNDLFHLPYVTDKARVHTNSWGSTGNFGVYDQQAHEVDEFVYNNRDMLICFAAGNDGEDANSNGQIDPNSVTPPGTAKNCLTVGASENNRPNFLDTYGQGWPHAFPANPIKSDRIANNVEGMVAFSSRGPTNDMRIKPDVVAPGSYILSTRSRATKSQGWGVSKDPLYMFDGGTSMATPLVAGCVATVRAYLRTQQGMKKPSAALLKALMINGAHDLQGQYSPSEAGTIPNNNEGFGRVDLQAVVGPYAPNEKLQFFDESKKLDTGQHEDRVIAIPAASRRLKVTLVWSDPPGEGLQSDLDLVVVAGAQERHGNMTEGSAEFDRHNNVEQVVWDQVPGNQVTISVVAHSVTLVPQNYALVVRVS
jgi:hypothetical protein